MNWFIFNQLTSLIYDSYWADFISEIDFLAI